MEHVNIVIIDRDHDWINSAIHYFTGKQEFHIAGWTTDPEEALELVKEKKPDIALLDLQNLGVQLCIEISRLNVAPIIISSFITKNLVVQAFYSGAVECVDRYDLNTISNAVGMLIMNCHRFVQT